jgi:hypothetical protein
MSRGSLRPVLAACVAAVACIAAGPQPDAARPVGPLETFVARAVDATDPAEATSPIEIMIERWSTAAEADTLRSSLSQGGHAALLPALEKTWQRAGVVLTPGIIGAGSRARTRRARNLMFARAIDTPNGRQIVLAAGQHVPLGELPAATRELQPEFTLIDIRLGADGKGVGKIAAASKVAYNEKSHIIELANYATQPVRLTEVRSAKP